MKLKFLTFMAAGMLMASCSSDDVLDVNGNTPAEGKEQTYGATVKLVLPSYSGTDTRANEITDNTEFDDGTTDEYKVIDDNVYFEFFDENKYRMGIVSGKEVKWTHDESNTNDNVTKTGEITLKANRQPAYIVAFINADSEVYSSLNTLSLTELKQLHSLAQHDTRTALKEHIASAANGFVMTNSSYYDKGNSLVQEVSLAGHIYEVKDGAAPQEATPVIIHVERVVAKVSLAVTVSEQARSTQAEGDKYFVIGTGDNAYGVKFLGWCLNATNKTLLPLKNIDETLEKFNIWNGSVVCNNPAYGRSYWAIDGNYNNSEGQYLTNAGFSGTTLSPTENNLSLNYYNLNEIKNPMYYKHEAANTAEYCFENTSVKDLYDRYGTVTHALLKAQYVDKSGNEVTGDIFRIGKNIYTETAMKGMVVQALKTAFPDATGDSEFQTSQITITGNKGSYKDREDVKGIIKYTGNYNLGNLNKDDLTQFVCGESTLWVYPQGLCYYSVPIKHFPDLTKETTGYYGVVRNHWYQISVDKIEGFGHPASPDKPIVPEGIEDNEWELQCTVKVLSWAKKTQNATVGGDQIWQ